MSSSKVLYDDVRYLEDFDFDGKILLASKGNNDVSIIMIYGAFCPHCVHALPEFDQVAKKVKEEPSIQVYAAQVDGERETEKALGQKLKDAIPGFKGAVPMFVIFKNGLYVATFEGDRKANKLMEFINKNK